MCEEKDAAFELAKDIHSQYAENNNEVLTCMISMIVSMLSVVGTYGYMFVHTTMKTAYDFGMLHLGDKKYSIEVLLLTASVCFICIYVAQYLCIYEGFLRRSDQFAAQAIRKRYGFNHELLPKTFSPQEKNKRKFIPGLFGEIIKVLTYFIVLIALTTLLKLFSTPILWTKVTFISFGIFLFLLVLVFVLKSNFISNRYRKYIALKEEFKEFNI